MPRLPHRACPIGRARGRPGRHHVGMSQALREVSDDDLVAAIKLASEHVTYYVQDYERELDRRANERQAKEHARVAKQATAAAVVSAVAAPLAFVVAVVVLLK